MSGKGSNPNSKANLKVAGLTQEARMKGVEARQRKKKLKQLLKECTTEEEWIDLIQAWKKESKKNPQFANIIIGIKENYKNREIKAKEKSNEVGQGILDHIKGLEVKKEIEVPFTPYEETGLQPE